MKSPVLILFIIFNLLTINLASAINISGDESGESHQMQLLGDNSHDTSLNTCVDENSCDHSCHISAHMIGFISYLSTHTTSDASEPVSRQDHSFYSLSSSPPSQPPRS